MADLLMNDTKSTLEQDVRALRDDMTMLRADVRADLQDLRRDVGRLSHDTASSASRAVISGAQQGKERFEHSVETHPLASTFLALSFGLGLGLLFGRRSTQH